MVILSIMIASLGGCDRVRASIASAEQSRAIVTSVCSGRASAPSAAYVPTGSIKFLAGQRSARGDWSTVAGLPPDLAAQNAEEAALVLCLEPPKQVDLDACHFDRVVKVGGVTVPGTAKDGPSFRRAVETQEARLVEARTGIVLAEKVFRATERSCSAPVVGKPKETDFLGRLTGLSAQVDWARRIAARPTP